MAEKKEEKTEYIKWLSELSHKDLEIAGGKGASLAEMFNKKFPVPPAFIVTAQTFEKFISPVKEEIDKIIDKTDVDNTKELTENSKKIRELVEKQKIDKEIEQEISEAYEALGTERQQPKENALNILSKAKEVFVAVRSSATTEDLASASFAGQQETFLNIKGDAKLIEKIKKCFSSLYTPRAIFYREKRGFRHAKALLAVVVQRMINSEKSGVMFTKNPMREDKNISIEAVFGLGEGIVSGRIQPDNYLVSQDLEVLEKKIADKKKALIKSESGETEEIKLTEEKSKKQVLTDGEIRRLADYGMQIEKHYKKPQDIEFAIEDREIYIVQSRPITTSARKTQEITGRPILTGLAASPGVASGKVKIVRSMQDLDKIEKGDILVTEMTNPDMVVTMQKCDAIVTDEGGSTAHAAIVSREMGIPAVVGTKTATQFLEEGKTVTVDGTHGKIYEGEVGQEQKKEILPVEKTKTKIKVILDLPDFAERAAKSGCSEVGLLRLEGIIAGSGKHPMLFLAENRLGDYSKLLEQGIKKIAEHFKSVWVRTSDIRTDEYRNLQGAPKEQETNPMLGFHGIRFSLRNKEILESELQALKKTAERFPEKEIGVMFPQIISVEDVTEAKRVFEKFRKKNMRFGIMVETPAACMIIQDLCEEGIDFISFGTNDLTQYTLALDRGNENVQDLYNEMHPAVLALIAGVIGVCKENAVETSICGQAASKKEMAQFLVEQGINSLSVNADAAYEISKLVQELEGASEEKEPKKEEPEEEKPIEQEEFPDTDIEIDVFSPITTEELPGIAKEQAQIHEAKDKHISKTDDLSSVEEKIEDIQEEVEEEKKEKQKEAEQLDESIETSAEVSEKTEEKETEEETGEQTEEDEEIQEAVEEMRGKRDEEDIDIQEETGENEEEDEEKLDIF